MPSASPVSRVYDWATTQRNITIFAAILVAVPTAYATRTAFAGGVGDFLLLVTLAVGVPTAYDEHWPRYDRTSTAVSWILVACAVVTVEFVGLSLVGTELLGLDPIYASAGAFLVTDFGNLAWLAARRRT